MTIEELKLKIPEACRPLAEQYGPVFLNMAAVEVTNWIQRVAAGDTYGAYQEILKKLPNADLLAEMQKNLSEWDAANAANAARMDVMGQAMTGILKVMLTIALTTVGL